MKILVKTAEVRTRAITRARDQKKFAFREQDAFVTLGEEVRLIALTLTEDQAAYPPGQYEVLLDGSVYVDRNNRLALGRLALKPLVAAAPQARQGG